MSASNGRINATGSYFDDEDTRITHETSFPNNFPRSTVRNRSHINEDAEVGLMLKLLAHWMCL